MADGVNLDELVPGRRYRVDLADCCVQGFFEATFVEAVWFPADEDGPGDVELVRFDCAEVGPGGGQWIISEL